jgi:hypothetical protein
MSASTVRTPLSETLLAPPGSLPSAFHRTVKERPSIDIPAGVHSHAPEGALRPDAATRPTRSVSAVPPRHDGFLLQRLRGPVASHCRSWGPPGFDLPCRACPHHTPRPPHRCHTLQSSPLHRPRSHPSPRGLPPRRSPAPSRDAGSTSRPSSFGESVAPAGRCRPGTPGALLGFSSPSLRAPPSPPIPRGEWAGAHLRVRRGTLRTGTSTASACLRMHRASRSPHRHRPRRPL